MKTTEDEIRKHRRRKPVPGEIFPGNTPEDIEHARRMLEYANHNQYPEIEKNVPAPHRTPGRGRSHKYSFHEMEVGDSYFRAGDPDKAANALRQALLNAKKRFPEMADREFITAERSQAEHGETGARIWRMV